MGIIDINFSSIDGTAETGQGCSLAGFLHGDTMYYSLWENNDLKEIDTIGLNDDKKYKRLAGFNLKSANAVIDSHPFAHVDFNSFEAFNFKNYLPKPKSDEKLSETYEKFKQQKIFSLYYLKKSSENQVKALRDKSKAFHVSTGMANFLLNESDQILLLFFDDILHLALKQNGKFKFYNRYQSREPRNFLYYILLVCKQFELDPSQFKINAGGAITESSPLHELLNSYLANLSLFSSQKFTSSKSKFPAAYYLPFVLAKSCE